MYKTRVRTHRTQYKAALTSWRSERRNKGIVYQSMTDQNMVPIDYTDRITDLVRDDSKPYERDYVKDGVRTGRPVYKPVDQSKTTIDWWNSGSEFATGTVGTYNDQLFTTGGPVPGGLNNPSYWLTEDRGLPGLPAASLIRSWYKSADISYWMQEKLLSDRNVIGLQDDINLLAFIGELKDLRRLIDLFLPGRSLTAPGLSLSSRVFDTTTEKFLGYSFGLVPMYEDIKNILDRLLNLPNLIRKWNEQAARQMILNVHGTLPIPPEAKNYPLLRNGDGDVMSVPRKGYCFLFPKENKSIVRMNNVSPGRYMTGYYGTSYYGRTWVLAKASVYYIPLQLDGRAIKNLETTLWGFDHPLGAVWELMPFSFVVDWFIRIGDAIDAFETSKPTLPLIIVDGGFSVKTRIEVTQQSHIVLTTPFKRVVNCGGYSGVFQRYTRQTLLPATRIGRPYLGLDFKVPKDGQMLLGSALLWQLLCTDNNLRHL